LIVEFVNGNLVKPEGCVKVLAPGVDAQENIKEPYCTGVKLPVFSVPTLEPLAVADVITGLLMPPKAQTPKAREPAAPVDVAVMVEDVVKAEVM
jgi:hypothetical protein